MPNALVQGLLPLFCQCENKGSCSAPPSCLLPKPLGAGVQCCRSGPAHVLMLACPVVTYETVRAVVLHSSVHLPWSAAEAQVRKETSNHCCESVGNFIICKRNFLPPPCYLSFPILLTGIIILNTFVHLSSEKVYITHCVSWYYWRYRTAFQSW